MIGVLLRLAARMAFAFVLYPLFGLWLWFQLICWVVG